MISWALKKITSVLEKCITVERVGVFSTIILAQLFCVPAAFAAVFVNDTFTDTAGTSLTAHTGELGATWTSLSAFSSAAVISNANRLRSDTAGYSVFYASGVPSSADYVVSADFHVASESGVFGLIGRSGTVATTYYLFDYESTGQVKLYTVVDGSVVGVTESASWAPVVGQTYTFKLAMEGNLITGYINDVQVLQKTDSNITSAGRAGFLLFDPTTNTTGYHIDNFYADTTINPTDTGFVNVESSHLWENGYSSLDNPRQSTLSFLRLTTDASILRIVATTSNFNVAPTGFASLGLRIDGVDQAPIVFTANGKATTTHILSNGTKTIDITVGPQNRPASVVLGTFLESFRLLGHTTYTVQSPVNTGRLVVYGDSISGGYSDTLNYGTKGWTSLLRNAGRKTMIEGYGYRSLSDDAGDGVARAAFVSRLSGYAPNVIWLAIGTNDYGLNKWSAASFGTAYAALLDDLHAALPTTQIFCQTPLIRTTETANVSGSTLSDYRTEIVNSCTARAWTTLVDGTGILETSDLTDGVHPSTSGHAKYMNFVAPYVATTGGVTGALSASSGNTGIPVTLTLTRALGSTFRDGDQVTVNWGDGSTSVVTPVTGSVSDTATHTYSSGGSFAISITNNRNWPNPSNLAYTAISPVQNIVSRSTPSPKVPAGGFTARTHSSPTGTVLRSNFGGDISTIVIATSTRFTSAKYFKATSALVLPKEFSQTLYVKYCNRQSRCSEPVTVQSDTAPAVTQSSFTFTRDLSLKSTSQDVLELQRYLNNNGFIIATSGPGSPGKETSSFGALTFKALVRFQEAFAKEILAPNGLTRGTGYFGSATRAFINKR